MYLLSTAVGVVDADAVAAGALAATRMRVSWSGLIITRGIDGVSGWICCTRLLRDVEPVIIESYC